MPKEIDTPGFVATQPDGEGFAIDFESDEPLACPLDSDTPVEGCESCQ